MPPAKGSKPKAGGGPSPAEGRLTAKVWPGRGQEVWSHSEMAPGGRGDFEPRKNKGLSCRFPKKFKIEASLHAMLMLKLLFSD